MKRINVLVFPCGSEVGLEIQRALARSIHVDLHGASSRDDHGRLAFERYIELPNIVDADFDERFAELLAGWDIQLVFATHDSVLAYLAPRMAAWRVHLVNGDPQSTQIARSKAATYALLAGEDWLPRLFAGLDEVERWPVLLKPDQRQGGQGVTLVTDRMAAEVALATLDQPLICEYLPGEELTVDCFSDWRGQLLYIGPRSRERVVGGIAMRSRRIPVTQEVGRIAKAIHGRLKFRGPWFFQLKRDEQGGYKLLEVSCRLSSSSVVQRVAGVNLPLMAVQDFMARDLKVLDEPRVVLVERCLASHAVLAYAFDTVYMDFDDTLVCGGRANPQAMRFAYRVLEMGRRLVLLTRHEGSLEAALAEARIAESLFDEIIHLRSGEPKSSVVEGAAIFIDNHFPERLDVALNRGIPVFDVDALELLFP
ncbi:carbamoyl-phosphate synthase large subunit [Stutzerimonas stutzeri]|uniref:Carbamoyl-phosphate synthase large subunit n=1 Tax=Stutzerimonas stutzeri TaxID=316 RepID=A0A2S4AT05_STUST|nr:ATP-grasp domain-containing protein [Stutzerimonas stutzeri]MCQ4261252.1 ATP-grasp domain-containing protein [Stutzerimonas stutzeri]POH84570.1 carbamoyl-phosphate synthase large subunit [Stutzerimonas stutzeri]